MMQPRIRNVKPQVHLDAELWDVEVESGMPLFRVFLGLWNFCDREGRFQWEPRVLATQILPWWKGDFEQAMQWLVPKFIVRYEVDGREYGWVRTFTLHQRPTNREPDSRLPAPPPQAANDNGRVKRGKAKRRRDPFKDVRVVGPDIADFVENNECAPLELAQADLSKTEHAQACLPELAPRPSTLAPAPRVGNGSGIGKGNGSGNGREPPAHLHAPAHARDEGLGDQRGFPGYAELEPQQASEELDTKLFDSGTVVRLFSALRTAAGGGRYQLKRTDYDRALAAAEWAQTENPADPAEVCTQSISNFVQFARDKEADGWPFWGWANDPGRWLATRGTSGVMARVTSRTELEADAQRNPDWAR